MVAILIVGLGLVLASAFGLHAPFADGMIEFRVSTAFATLGAIGTYCIGIACLSWIVRRLTRDKGEGAYHRAMLSTVAMVFPFGMLARDCWREGIFTEASLIDVAMMAGIAVLIFASWRATQRRLETPNADVGRPA